jgi:hypothetical protein
MLLDDNPEANSISISTILYVACKRVSVAPDCTHRLALSMLGLVSAKTFISAYVLVLRHRNQVLGFDVVIVIVVSASVIVV